MVLSFNRTAWFLAAALLATAGCSGTRTVPTTSGIADGSALRAQGVDTKSVLKLLTQQVTIGSTIDPVNGDRAPRGLSVVPLSYVLTKGQLLVCNSSNKANAAGKGSTIEVLNPSPGSKPARFASGASLVGCDAVAISQGNSVWSSAFTAHSVSRFDQAGKLGWKSPSKAFAAPFGAVYALGSGLYPAEIVFVSDAKNGTIDYINVADPSSSFTTITIATGFPVSTKANALARGPSGMQYSAAADTLYIVDGVDNSIVAFSHASKLVLKNAIVVKPGGKFSGPEAKWASVIYSGSPLNRPVAAALLPNGNLIVANTGGGNTLVELTPTGKVLDTKVADPSAKAAIFGMLATGTSDSDTALFFTDTNSNTIQELKQ
jgi:hypothetical protein